MIGLVAIVVATVILVFSASGTCWAGSSCRGRSAASAEGRVAGTLAPLMGAVAVFGIENDGLNLAVNLLVLFLVAIWLALVFWTYFDASRRIATRLLVGCATAASLFAFVGTIVYVIVRPPEYLADVREGESRSSPPRRG